MKNDIKRLKRKIFFQGIFIVAGCSGVLVILTILFLGTLRDITIAIGKFIFITLLGMETAAAYNLMDTLREYSLVFIIMGMGFILLFVYNHSLTRFARYFNDLDNGVDKLIDGSSGAISMPSDIGFMSVKLNDIKSTLEKRSRDAKEAEQRKNDLVVYLAHDIKTPLTSVIGYLNLLEEAPDMPFEQRCKYTKLTLDKAYRLETLINEFFDITRFNLQTIPLEKSAINLTHMLEQMADEFYPMMIPEGKQAEVHAPEGLGIIADADKLARVFNNILKNAIAYSYPDTTIYIDAMEEEGNIIVTFTNDGHTIPAQRLEMLFEKFYRLDSARTSDTGGAGLGLAIAREIVHAHGGIIEAQSSDEKIFFKVTLPL